MSIKIYYWPLDWGGRALAPLRLLEYKNVPYEWISDKSEMDKLCSAFGAKDGNTFAPPVIVDGEVKVSQSTATTYYLGKKLGMEPAAFSDYKAMQFLIDIQV